MESQKTQPDTRPESGRGDTDPEVSKRRNSATTGPAPFAAAVYPAKKGGREGLAKFVDALKQTDIRVGGILQEKVALGDGGMVQVEAVDIATGQRVPINKPTAENWRNRDCSLDVSALATTTAMLRSAIDDGVDLIVVEKFGDEEREGKGLIDEILEAIAMGIPLLIAVPETNLEIWTERSGGMGNVLPFDEKAFQNWWTRLNG